MLCYSERKVILSCVCVFFSKQFDVYVKSMPFGLKCCREVTGGMLGQSKVMVTLSCDWVFFTVNFYYYVKSMLMGLKC